MRGQCCSQPDPREEGFFCPLCGATWGRLGESLQDTGTISETWKIDCFDCHRITVIIIDKPATSDKESE